VCFVLSFLICFIFPRTILVDVTSSFCWDPDYLEDCFCAQKDCFEVYALVPGLLREEVSILWDALFFLPFYLLICSLWT
jgi:hypothetical protein